MNVIHIATYYLHYEYQSFRAEQIADEMYEENKFNN